MLRVFLTTFHPLCSRKAGREAAERLGIPPYVDSSCRREPDLESRWPSISALCHGKLFAPKLQPSDVVVFLAAKKRYPGDAEACRRLVAVLQVRKRFESHPEAAAWYRARGLPLPGNCVVKGNRPLPLSHTGRTWRSLCDWDEEYQKRAKKWGAFLACRPLYRNLHDPPALSDKQMIEVFGKIPGMLNPPQREWDEYLHLLSVAGVRRATKKARPGAVPA